METKIKNKISDLSERIDDICQGYARKEMVDEVRMRVVKLGNMVQSIG